MSLQKKIEILPPRSKQLKLGKERVFTAETDIKGLFRQGRKGLGPAFERQPTWRMTVWMEEHEFMIPASQSIADFDIPPHTSKNFDVRKESGNLHWE
jgi:hypothetical protein